MLPKGRRPAGNITTEGESNPVMPPVPVYICFVTRPLQIQIIQVLTTTNIFLRSHTDSPDTQWATTKVDKYFAKKWCQITHLFR
jgi:hypothetical protein